ncbi:MAG: DUF378 domain-containing protein [bacterium]|nr:DUF378 domain-containing protein [bacterium]
MKKLSSVDWIALILVIVGGLNWGLVGFFGWNLVDAIFGMDSTLGMIVYDLVGLSALYLLVVSGSLSRKGMATQQSSM